MPAQGDLIDVETAIKKKDLTATTNPPIPMLKYALIFLVIAIVAGVLGFGSLSGTAAWIAKVLVVVFLVLFVVSLLRGKSG
jgi:uncharacterized membrane protein YtjA (UPF0391 family)